MTEFKEHMEAIKGLKELHLNLRKNLKLLLVNTDYTLDERWQMFLEGSYLLEDYYYTPASMDILSNTMYDDFYMERRETKSFADIDDQIMENYDPNSDDEQPEKYARMYAKRDEWREAVLAEGYRGFTYDW